MAPFTHELLLFSFLSFYFFSVSTWRVPAGAWQQVPAGEPLSGCPRGARGAKEEWGTGAREDSPGDLTASTSTV